jgi:hypothetical protein
MRRSKRAAKAEDQSDAELRETSREHEPCNPRRRGAERHANADLTRAPRRCLCNDCVDADRCHEEPRQREREKQRAEHDQEPALPLECSGKRAQFVER